MPENKFKDKLAHLERFLKNQKAYVSGAEIKKELGISTQMLSYYIKKLEQKGVLDKQGSTRAASYKWGVQKKLDLEIELLKDLQGLEEDLVFKELSSRSTLKQVLKPEIYNIFQYAFTKILNNSIDHSKSQKAKIRLAIENKKVSFLVTDKGIGIFNNLSKKFNLKNDFEAIEHLFKGKQTTDPIRHSGQGIFFTSRISDIFWIRSGKTKVTIDNLVQDTFLADTKKIGGTEVFFSISLNSRRKLKALFEKYSNQDLEFDRNKVKVKLSQFEGLLSRSQAKRLLVGLEKFAEIEFDFSGVPSIGQAFADEIFRIYQRNHPDIFLISSNAKPSVAYMVERAKRTSI